MYLKTHKNNYIFFEIENNEIINLIYMLPGIDIFIELQNCTVTTDESIVLKLAEDVYSW